MNDLRKAAEMALEALLKANQKIVPGGVNSDTRAFMQESIKALRQALSQSEEKMRIEGSGKLTTKPYPEGYESEHDFRKALAQPEQEPVCFIRETAWSYEISPWDDPKGFPVYTAPPKKEWVGLTDEEVNALLWKLSLGAVDEDVRTIEAKIKEKNT